MFVNEEALKTAGEGFLGQVPFDHCVIDNFFVEDIAYQLLEEFPAFEDSCWHEYNNPIEIKKTCNSWNAFAPLTYRAFAYLNSPDFVQLLTDSIGVPNLSSDPGLNGGGWHIHKRGGKLNPHLDYSIHPKLALQRKLNIIIYMNPEWKPGWGGQLGLWEQAEGARKPGQLVRTIDPIFNRAVLFDTTQNSWHGLSTPLQTPEEISRKSLAIYYLTPAPAAAEKRGKALFAPTPDQEQDPAVLKLISKRARVETASDVYKGDK